MSDESKRKADGAAKLVAGLCGTVAALGFLSLGCPVWVPLTVLAAVEVGGGLARLME